MAPADRYRQLSFWHDTVPGTLTPGDPLPADTEADVAIVGAGFTGMWTAYYLHQADPALRIVVCEREIAGYGASGRNGGWCSALFPASLAKLQRMTDRAGAIGMQRAMHSSAPTTGRPLSGCIDTLRRTENAGCFRVCSTARWRRPCQCHWGCRSANLDAR